MLISRLQANLGPAAIQYRWPIIIVMLLIAAAIGSGVSRLSFTTDLRVFFSERNPQLQALETLENVYTKDENILFILAPSDGKVFTRQTLTAVDELTAASWKLPFASRVDSVTNFQHTFARADELIVEDLVPDTSALSNEELARVSDIALAEPLLVNRLVSPTGHVTAVNVNLLIPGASVEEVPTAAMAGRELAAQIRERYPEIDLYVDGGVMMDYAFGEAGQRDMKTLAPIMFIVLIAITGLALRSLSATFATMMVITMAMVTGLGGAGWLGIELTPASVGAPTIILTLAVADSVHILTILLRTMQTGESKSTAIYETMRVNLVAVFLTSITTALGFLSMNFSDAPPFRDLGNIVAIGVLGAFVYSVLFLPALMSVLPVKVKVDKASAHCPPCDRIADFVIHNCRPVFWSTLAVAVTLSAGTLLIHLDDDWMAYFDESYEIRQATDFLEANLTGGHIIEYSIGAGAVSGINDPEYLAKLEEFAQWYRKQEKVVHVSVLSETIKRLNKNMHDDDPEYYRLPSTRELTAQYLLLYELSLPFGLDLNNTINIDKSATRMRVLLRGTTTSQLRDMDTQARQWLNDNAPTRMHAYGTGLSVIWAHLSERNIRNMLTASFGALIVISMLLVFALRSVRLGLLSLVPNLAPALVAFGVWGLLVGQVGLGLSVTVSMTLGIVVDDTVHFLTKYLRGRRELGLAPPDAVRRAFHRVGTAMWITTVALVAGFGVLALSSYRMTADMGLVSALTITLALALDFLLLPTLLLRVDTKAIDATPQKKTAKLTPATSSR
ncbi:MAG: MMPL family transporter [Gammaproteobacteria bacterium]|nr:MMPL family transporter [Gammaproteobacteria bacterium]